MPTWQPDWTDVHFDHQIAEMYASACDDAARGLFNWIYQHEAAARTATDEWHGPHRDTFDHVLLGLHDQARTAAVAFFHDAELVREASAAARAEQLRRVDDRQRWQRQAVEEEDDARRIAERARADQVRAEEEQRRVDSVMTRTTRPR